MTKTRSPTTAGPENPPPTGVRQRILQAILGKVLEQFGSAPDAVPARAKPLRPVIGMGGDAGDDEQER